MSTNAPAHAHAHDPACIFCKIVAGQIPSFTLIDSPAVFAFLDINPISSGHALVIPKHHGAKLHDLPDSALRELLPAAKRIAEAMGLQDYNLLQNNGRIAHQEVDHVHFHVIPKPAPTDEEGLVIGWPAKKPDMTALDNLAKQLRERIEKSDNNESNL